MIEDDAKEPVSGDGNTQTGSNATPPPSGEKVSKAKEKLRGIQARIDEITETLGESDTWTRSQIQEVRQELADLKSSLHTITEALPNLSSLQEQLTQTRHELSEVSARIPVISSQTLETQLPIPDPAPENRAAPTNGNNRKREKRLL